MGGKNIGSNNGQWKGDNVKYGALHEWVRNRLPKPELCEDCNKVPPRDLANISQKYLRELDDWEWLCRSCHMMKDGRMKVLNEYGKSCLGKPHTPFSEETIKKLKEISANRTRDKFGRFKGPISA